MTKLTNDEAEELIRQGWSSPENTALLKERMDELRARADRAEACYAEMRDCIQEAHDELVSFSHRYRLSGFQNLQLGRFKHALSTDCGKGWLSPEKAKAMQDTIDEDVRHLTACSAALSIEKARNQRLVEALKEIKKSSAPYYMRDIAREALAANQKAQP